MTGRDTLYFRALGQPVGRSSASTIMARCSRSYGTCSGRSWRRKSRTGWGFVPGFSATQDAQSNYTAVVFCRNPLWNLLGLLFCLLIMILFFPQLEMCGSNMEAIYDKKIAKKLLPVEYLPDDYTGPNNGTIKELLGEYLRPPRGFLKTVSFGVLLCDCLVDLNKPAAATNMDFQLNCSPA